MKFLKYQWIFTVAIFLFILASPLTAEAYIDPGTGSLIIQAVIAAVAATGFAIKIYWRRIRNFKIFSRKAQKKIDNTAGTDAIKGDEYGQQQQK